jgi:hypothetical protein
MKKPISILAGIAFVFVGGVFIAVVFGGVYNVAATDGHTAPVEWVLRTTMESSVRNQASDIQVPDTINLNDPAFAAPFVEHYDAACVTCHAAPGKDRDPWMVIYPDPPDLTKQNVVARWSDEELYWILRHGIMDTGMMALGPTHPDEAIWGVTAFVRQLPHMSAAEYEGLVREYISSMDEM